MHQANIRYKGEENREREKKEFTPKKLLPNDGEMRVVES